MFCQATRDSDKNGKLSVSVGQHGKLSGDDLELYLGLAKTEPERIDAFWGTDPSERWLIVKHGPSAEVIDTSANRRFRLDPDETDLREIGDTSLPHRALAFDSRRQRLLFARELGKDRFEIRARSLTSGEEEVVHTVSGRLWTLRTSEDGQWLVVQHVSEDTSGNGRLDLPAPTLDEKPRCHGPIRQFSAWLPAGDALATTIVSLKTGRANRVDDFAAPFGASFLFRDRTGVLFMGDGRKKQRLADRACGAQVIYADPKHRLVLAGCRGPQPLPGEEKQSSKKADPPRTRWPLRLLGPGLDRDLELDLGPTGHDHWPSGSPRLLAVHAGAATRLLDLQTRRLIEVEAGTFIVATHGTRALLLTRRRLTLLDTKNDKKLLELGGVAHTPTLLVEEPSALVSPYVVDLEKGRLVGRVTDPVLALGKDGQVLEALGAPASVNDLAQGPLAWRAPKGH